MEINEMIINLKADATEALNKVVNMLNVFKSFESQNTKVANSLKKVNDSISPTTKKLNDLATTTTKVSDEFQNSLYKALGIRPTIDTTGFEAYEKKLNEISQETKDSIKRMQKEYDVYQNYIATHDFVGGRGLVEVTGADGTKTIVTFHEIKKAASDLKRDIDELSTKEVKINLSDVIKDANDGRRALQILVDEVEKSRNTPSFETMNNALNDFIKKTGVTKKQLKDLANEADNAGKKINKSFGGRLLSGIGKSFGFLGKVGIKSFGLLGKNAVKVFGFLGKGSIDNVDKLTSKFKKMGLGLLGVRTAMSLLTKAVSSYMSFDSALQDSVSNSWNMLGSLLAPAIELVVQLFATATNYVYQFVKALSGIDLVARANAKALQSQTAASKTAAQAQRSLSSMDEITNLQTESAGSEAPQISAPEIDSTANNFIKDLIDKIKAGDWYGAGSYIADAINKGLEKLDVKGFTDKLRQGFINATDMFNGFVETLNWGLLGEKTSDAMVGVTGAIRAGIENIHWDSLGQGISDFLTNIDWVGLVDNIVSSITGIIKGIIEAFNKIDFATLMKQLSEAFRKGLQDITQAIADIDWRKVGQQIADFLMNIDWLGIGLDIVNLLVQGILGIGDLLLGVIDKIIEFFESPDAITKMLEAGANLVLGLFKGMVSIVAKIGEIIGRLIDLVKSMLGIHSPSTVFADIGVNLILGLVNGIASMLSAVINIFKGLWDSIVNGAKTAFEKIPTFFKGIIDKIKSFVINIATSVGNLIAGAFRAVVNGVLNAIESILNVPIRAINSLIKTINKVPGINISRLNTFNLPRLATGTNNIPEEGIYHLHEGEAVVPKKYNPATGGYDNGADNKQIIDLLFTLNQTMIEIAEKDNNVYLDGRQLAEGLYDPLKNVTKNKNVSNVVTRS